MKKGKELHFGIMCFNMNFAEWKSKTILNLLDIKGVKCKLLIIYDGIKSSKHHIKPRKSLNTSLWKYYERTRKYNSLKNFDLSEALINVDQIKCKIIKKGKYSQYFERNDIDKIKNYKLDFILRFGFGIIRGDILDVAKYGIWSFHHGDETRYRGGPPGFWEIYNNDKITGSVLQKLTNKLDGGIILKKGFFKTNQSYSKNRDQIYFETARWPSLICIDLLNEKLNLNQLPVSNTEAKIYYDPKSTDVIKFLINSLSRRIKAYFEKKIYYDNWNFGIVKTSVMNFFNDDNIKINWFPYHDKNRFFADPFGISYKNKLYIFFEELPFNTGKGYISFTCYENGRFSSPEKVLNEPFHLSYPYLIKHQNNIFMIPEAHESNKIVLYKSENFPYSWKKEVVLLDNYPGVDTTIIEHDGLFWMFTSNKKDGLWYNLNLFFSDNLFSGWKPHPQNPIKTDIRSSRSAGRPFVYKNDIIRPSMNYSEKIEGSIVLNKIKKMTKFQYEENFYKEILPFKNSEYNDKTHHICISNEYIIFDASKRNIRII